jgi:hypothetical protein
MIIKYKELTEIMGKKQPAALENALIESGIHFLRGGNGKPFTTLDALNAAMGINTQHAPKEDQREEIHLL